MRTILGYHGVFAFYCDNEHFQFLSSQDVLNVLSDNDTFMMKSVEYKSRTNGHGERQIGVVTATDGALCYDRGWISYRFLASHASTRCSSSCSLSSGRRSAIALLADSSRRSLPANFSAHP